MALRSLIEINELILQRIFKLGESVLRATDYLRHWIPDEKTHNLWLCAQVAACYKDSNIFNSGGEGYETWLNLIHPILSEDPNEPYELDLENTIILPPRYKGYHARMTELEFLSRYADNHVSYATFIGLVLDSMARDHNVIYPDMPREMKVNKSEGTRKQTTS